MFWNSSSSVHWPSATKENNHEPSPLSNESVAINFKHEEQQLYMLPKSALKCLTENIIHIALNMTHKTCLTQAWAQHIMCWLIHIFLVENWRFYSKLGQSLFLSLCFYVNQRWTNLKVRTTHVRNVCGIEKRLLFKLNRYP